MARPSTFSENEIQWLTQNYSHSSWEDVLENVKNKTKTQIISKASKLGLVRSGVSFSTFTKQEDDTIKKYYHAMSISDFISKYMPERTASSIVSRASKIGAHKQGCWTAEEDRTIIDNYYEMPMEDLAELLPNRAKSAIHYRIRMLGLSGAARYKYSADDIKFVADNYEYMSDAELADVLHREPASIKEMRRKNKIYRKNPEAGTNYKSLMRFIQAHNAEWKKKSMANCGFRCVITGGAFDDIHHLYAKNQIVNQVLENLGINIDELDINTCDNDIKERILNDFKKEQEKYPLGVCLSKKLHRAFHAQYGFGNNTPEQFLQFVQRVAPDSLHLHE